VVADEPRLAGGGAHVLGLRGNLQADRDGLLRLGLFLAATTAAAHAARGLLGLVGGLFGLVGGLLGLAGLASLLALGLLGGGLSRGGSRLGGLFGLLGSGDRGLRAGLVGSLSGLLGGSGSPHGLGVGALLLVLSLAGVDLVGLLGGSLSVGGQLVDT